MVRTNNKDTKDYFEINYFENTVRVISMFENLIPGSGDKRLVGGCRTRSHRDYLPNLSRNPPIAVACNSRITTINRYSLFRQIRPSQ